MRLFLLTAKSLLAVPARAGLSSHLSLPRLPSCVSLFVTVWLVVARFATGAGFYVNATQEPWNANFHMYDYITKELPEVVAANFPVDCTNGASRESEARLPAYRPVRRARVIPHGLQRSQPCLGQSWACRAVHNAVCAAPIHLPNTTTTRSFDHGPLDGWTWRPHDRPEEPWW